MANGRDARDPLETRLLIVAEMLDRAVNEVRRVMEEIRAERKPDDVRPITGESDSNG